MCQARHKDAISCLFGIFSKRDIPTLREAAGSSPSSYLQKRPLHTQDLHGIRISQYLQGVRCLCDSFDFFIDLSQYLIEEDVLDVHGEELTERTLFGWAKLHGVLYLLDESGKQSIEWS